MVAFEPNSSLQDLKVKLLATIGIDGKQGCHLSSIPEKYSLDWNESLQPRIVQLGYYNLAEFIKQNTEDFIFVDAIEPIIYPAATSKIARQLKLVLKLDKDYQEDVEQKKKVVKRGKKSTKTNIEKLTKPKLKSPKTKKKFIWSNIVLLNANSLAPNTTSMHRKLVEQKSQDVSEYFSKNEFNHAQEQVSSMENQAEEASIAQNGIIDVDQKSLERENEDVQEVPDLIRLQLKYDLIKLIKTAGGTMPLEEVIKNFEGKCGNGLVLEEVDHLILEGDAISDLNGNKKLRARILIQLFEDDVAENVELHNPCESTNAKDGVSIPCLGKEKNEIDITDLDFDKAYSKVWNKIVLKEAVATTNSLISPESTIKTSHDNKAEEQAIASSSSSDLSEKMEIVKIGTHGPRFICRICEIKTTSHEILQKHFTGTKHQAKLRKISKQAQTDKIEESQRKEGKIEEDFEIENELAKKLLLDENENIVVQNTTSTHQKSSEQNSQDASKYFPRIDVLFDQEQTSSMEKQTNEIIIVQGDTYLSDIDVDRSSVARNNEDVQDESELFRLGLKYVLSERIKRAGDAMPLEETLKNYEGKCENGLVLEENEPAKKLLLDENIFVESGLKEELGEKDLYEEHMNIWRTYKVNDKENKKQFSKSFEIEKEVNKMQLNEVKLDAQPEKTVFKKDKIEKVLICEMSKERNNEQEFLNLKKPNLFEIIRASQSNLLGNSKTEKEIYKKTLIEEKHEELPKANIIDEENIVHSGVIASKAHDRYFVYSAFFDVEPFLLNKDLHSGDETLEVCDWIKFICFRFKNGHIRITNYEKIEPLFPTQQFLNTIRLIVKLNVPVDYSADKYMLKIPAEFVGEAYDSRNIINYKYHAGKSIKAVVQRGKFRGIDTKWGIHRIFPNI